MKTPHVIGLVLCKSIGVDVSAGGMILTGVFHHLIYSAFPTSPQRFFAYAALYGGAGEGTIELAVSRLETEERIYRYQRWYAIPQSDLLIHLEIPVRRCAFPAPGRYGLSLRLDDEELAFRPLEIRLERGDR
jgi:hypothetical protein